MYNHLKAISISYKTAPVAVRELIALTAEQNQELLVRLKNYEVCSDILVISTCNRTEVFYTSEQDCNQLIINELLNLKSLNPLEQYQSYFLKIDNHQEAVKRLFHIAIGLESQVVGDIQIISQVKQAYQMAADLDTIGPFLHRLLHTIFFTNKKVVQETTFRSGAASTSYAAVELMEELALSLSNPKVLVLGLGEIGADVCRNLQNTHLQDITLINRTEEKAKALAEECGIKYLPFEMVNQAIQEADIIVSSIATEKPFIQKELLQNTNRVSYKFFIDLALPRSISSDIEELTGVLLYNIDQINNKVSDALAQRLTAIPVVEAIIENALTEFQDWTKEMEISPTIQKLKNALEQIRQEEITRHLKKMNQEEAQRLEQITKSMMQKIIKLPTLQLKAACKRGEAETLIDVLNDLFNLEKQAEKTA